MAAAIVQPLTRPRVAMLIASPDSQFRRRCLEEAGGYDKPNHEVERGHMRSLSSANVIVTASFWTGGCPTWMQAKWQDSYVNAIHAPQSKWWIPEWLPRPHWRVKASQITAARRFCLLRGRAIRDCKRCIAVCERRKPGGHAKSAGGKTGSTCFAAEYSSNPARPSWVLPA